MIQWNVSTHNYQCRLTNGLAIVVSVEDERNAPPSETDERSRKDDEDSSSSWVLKSQKSIPYPSYEIESKVETIAVQDARQDRVAECEDL